MNFKIGDKITIGKEVYIIAQSSRRNTRKKKVAMINIKNGENLGRIIEVQDYFQIFDSDLIKIHKSLSFLNKN
jgi:hypothetical protein